MVVKLVETELYSMPNAAKSGSAGSESVDRCAAIPNAVEQEAQSGQTLEQDGMLDEQLAESDALKKFRRPHGEQDV